MFKNQPGHISIMNTGHEINLTAILDLHVPLTLSVTTISVRYALDMRITVLIGRSNLNTLPYQQI